MRAASGSSSSGTGVRRGALSPVSNSLSNALSIPNGIRAARIWCFAGRPRRRAGRASCSGNIRLPAVLLLVLLARRRARARTSGSAPSRRPPRPSRTSARGASTGACSGGWLRPRSSGRWPAATCRECCPGDAAAVRDRRRAALQRDRAAAQAGGEAAPRGRRTASTSRPRSLTGLVIGLLGGIVGLILGSLRMPALVRIVGEVPARAVGTNVTIGFLVGRRGRDRPPALRAARTGTCWPSGAAASIPGALLGSRLTGRLSDSALLQRGRRTSCWSPLPPWSWTRSRSIARHDPPRRRCRPSPATAPARSSRPRRSGSAAWRCATGCWCTGPTTGLSRCARRTAGLRVESGAQAALPGRRSPSCPACAASRAWARRSRCCR